MHGRSKRPRSSRDARRAATPAGERREHPARTGSGRTVLVHLASGIGNILLATPLLRTLHAHGDTVDLLVDGDYPETAELFAGWDILRNVFNGRADQRPTAGHDITIAAIPPFYWNRYANRYAGTPNFVPRPADSLFYRDEQAYYLAFAHTIGIPLEAPPCYQLPAGRYSRDDTEKRPVVLAPGCKTGVMAAKRWPYFAELADRFDNVAVVGTSDDLLCWNGSPMSFPGHCRMLAGHLSLRETAGILASASVVVANDSGLGHLAAALGTPTVMLFGPTPDATLGRLPPNVVVLRSGLPCEPCWFTSHRFSTCRRRIDCLNSLTIDAVARAASIAKAARPVQDRAEISN